LKYYTIPASFGAKPTSKLHHDRGINGKSACTCAGTYEDYAVTYACTCRQYAYTMLALMFIRSILLWQNTGQRQMVSPAGKITGKSWIYTRLNKPPAGPPHFWLDKNARGLSLSAEPK